VVTAQYNFGNTNRLDPSSILVVFQALYKGFEGFVFVIAIDQAVHYKVYLVCSLVILNACPAGFFFGAGC